jgi:YebC/PmpR family DNA-binding regulatory protein
MSGHSKWSTIKRQKAVTDSRRSAVFTKLARQITISARLGGGDPTMNFRLRLAIDKAKAANVPNDNIERAIKSGTGEGKEGQTKEVLYEGFGPGGTAILVEAITDNPNRTAAEVRSTFSKHGGTMGAQHSVGWMFQLRGVTRVELKSIQSSREALELSCIDAGAEDVREDDEHIIVLSPPERLPDIGAALGTQTNAAESDVEYVPTTTVTLTDADQEALHALLEALDALDDVTRVTTNEQ